MAEGTRHLSNDLAFKLVKTFEFETTSDRDAFLDSECAGRSAGAASGTYHLPARCEVLGTICVAFTLNGTTLCLYDRRTIADVSPYQ